VPVPGPRNLLVFALLQRYLVRGIAETGIKG
jgi:ABC-type glycerol-3-phosphate transport system permease component